MQGVKRQTVMLVDDHEASLSMGKSILEPYYDVYALPSADKLFALLKHVTPDIILLDVEMPGINGYEAITVLKADKRYADIPVIFIMAKTSEEDEFDGLALGAIDYITKPFSAALLLKRVVNHLLTQKQKAYLQEFNDNLLQMVEEKTRQIFGLQNAIVGAVADLVEFRDNSTGWHVSRTQKYLHALVVQLIKDGVYTEELLTWNIDVVLSAAQLHDVGKISISDAILNKPAKLTPAEFEIMKTHVPRGVAAIERMKRFGYFAGFLEHAQTIAGTHHEKWDGSGYPRGLTGAEIPLAGRIMAIADVYDALISPRPYKQALTSGAAGRLICAGAGTHFDPAIVAVFQKLGDEFAAIAREYC
jgi:putative two-component system response regulator